MSLGHAGELCGHFQPNSMTFYNPFCYLFVKVANVRPFYIYFSITLLFFIVIDGFAKFSFVSRKNFWPFIHGYIPAYTVA